MKLPFIFKYKPANLDEFDYEKNLKKLIKEYINIDELNIILLGPYGSGKTSLVECILNEYYNNNIIESDILLINSLKEQGITYYRNEVKNFCQTLSSSNKKKSIIIDDIDTINEQCQQIFRNYIDKYHNNINIIMTCSNIHKIIESLKSRVNIIKIDFMTKNIINNILNKIIIEEKILITNQAKEKLFQISNFSLRNIINYMEKFKLFDNEININNIDLLSSNISKYKLEEYTNECINNNYINSLKILYNFCNIGYSLMDIYDEYFIYIKYSTIISNENKNLINTILCKYISIFYNIHEDIIELSFFNKEIIDILKL